MTRPGGRITVARSVVTGIAIDSSHLRIDGVDQDAEGRTLRSHTLLLSDEQLHVDEDLGDRVIDALTTIRKYAQHRIDEA